MAATMADALRMTQQERAAELRECDWHRIVREHGDASVVEQGIRAREAFDRAQRERAGIIAPDERIRNAFGHAHKRRRVEDFQRPTITFEGAWRIDDVFAEPHSSTHEYRVFEPMDDRPYVSAWETWQRTFARAFYGPTFAEWAEQATTQPEPDQPSQRVFTGELPEHYVDAGATGSKVEISEAELIWDRDAADVLNEFVQAARVHAPWLEVITIPNVIHGPPIEIRYQRPCITALPA